MAQESSQGRQQQSSSEAPAPVPVVLKAEELVALLGGRLIPDPASTAEETLVRLFDGVAPLNFAQPQHISFLANPRYRAEACASQAGLILCSEDDAAVLLEARRGKDHSGGGALLACRNPYAAFARVSQIFFRPSHGFLGQAKQAYIDATAEVSPDTTVFPFVYVGPGARIGRGCVLYPGAFVGAASELGDGCILYPNAVVREGCRLGRGCILNPGAVLGGDGFGFAPDGDENVKIPQIGGVVLGDEVEVGSNASVDRGTVGDTRVGSQTKIDSLVQLGHNVNVGKACFVAGLSGVAGSTKIADRVTIGGHVAVAGHLNLASGVILLGGCGVSKSLNTPGMYNGNPAVPNRDFLRHEALLRRLVKKEDGLRRASAQDDPSKASPSSASPGATEGSSDR